VIRLGIVWLYNGTEKASPFGGAIMVRYTNVFHCIDTARVRTMESDAMYWDAIEFVITYVVSYTSGCVL